MKPVVFLSLLITLLGSAGAVEFSFKDEGPRLTLLEGLKPVLVYNHGVIDPPADRAAKVAEIGLKSRTGYIHPLYGLDGDVLTDDYPMDHLHHRGIFWAWPKSTIGGKLFDLWLMKDCHTVPVGNPETTVLTAGSERQARIRAENSWVFDATPGVLVREKVELLVHPSTDTGRSIDLTLVFENVSGKEVNIQGTLDVSNGVQKGYGGFNVRHDGSRPEVTLATALGPQPEDTFRVKSGWADISSRAGEGKPFSGISVFQHRTNPAYPHDGWILRHYGFVGASWPCLDIYSLKPGDSLKLKYRLWVHRGDSVTGKTDEAFAKYEKE